MASSAQAARARLFMQRCRHPPTLNQPHNHTRSGSSLSDVNKYNPDNFGQKLRLKDNNTPLPQWRVTNASLPPSGAEPNTTTQDEPALTGPTFDLQNRVGHLPVPRYRNNPAITPGFRGWFKHSVLRLPEPPNPRDLVTGPINPTLQIHNNPYRARKQWPPLLTDLPEIRQLHYEKTFRRRLMLKVQNGRRAWDNGALFLRRYLILGVFLWFMLFAHEKDEKQRNPTDSLRYWIYGKLRGAEGWMSKSMAENVERRYEEYRVKHHSQWDPYNHGGWDESRAVNTLPNKSGKGSPPLLPPLGDGTSKESLVDKPW